MVARLHQEAGMTKTARAQSPAVAARSATARGTRRIPAVSAPPQPCGSVPPDRCRSRSPPPLRTGPSTHRSANGPRGSKPCCSSRRHRVPDSLRRMLPPQTTTQRAVNSGLLATAAENTLYANTAAPQRSGEAPIDPPPGPASIASLAAMPGWSRVDRAARRAQRRA